MSANIRKRKTGGGFYTYLLSRGSTFAFVGFFMGGLALGSLFCISGSDGSELLYSIVQNDIELQMGRSFLELLINSISGFAGIFIFIYLCINSSKGALLIYAVPLLHGLAVGSMVTTVMVKNGYEALSYILLCIFTPKVIETLLLLSVCNKTARYCKEQFGDKTNRKRGEDFPIALYFVVFGVYFVVESLMIYFFRGLF